MVKNMKRSGELEEFNREKIVRFWGGRGLCNGCRIAYPGQERHVRGQHKAYVHGDIEEPRYPIDTIW